MDLTLEQKAAQDALTEALARLLKVGPHHAARTVAIRRVGEGHVACLILGATEDECSDVARRIQHELPLSNAKPASASTGR